MAEANFTQQLQCTCVWIVTCYMRLYTEFSVSSALSTQKSFRFLDQRSSIYSKCEDFLLNIKIILMCTCKNYTKVTFPPLVHSASYPQILLGKGCSGVFCLVGCLVGWLIFVWWSSDQRGKKRVDGWLNFDILNDLKFMHPHHTTAFSNKQHTLT